MKNFRSLPHLLDLAQSQNQMHRFTQKLSSARKQDQVHKLKLKGDEDADVFMTDVSRNEPTKAAGNQPKIGKLKGSKIDRTTVGCVTYHDNLSESERTSTSSINKDGLSGNFFNQKSEQLKKDPKNTCVKIEHDESKTTYSSNLPNEKTTKTTASVVKSPEQRIDDNHKISWSDYRKSTISEVQEDLRSKRKRMKSSEEMTFKELPSSPSSHYLKVDAGACNNKGSSEWIHSNSLRRFLPSSSPSSWKTGEEDGSQDGASVSSSSEEYLQILGAAQELDNMGNSFFKRGDYQSALTSYSKALRVKQKSLECGLQLNAKNKKDLTERLLTSVATSINNIGYLLQRSGVPVSEVMAAYKDSLQIKQQILGDEHLSVGRTLNNIGSVYFKNHDYRQALEAYKQAQTIMIANLGQDHLDVATVHSNIADVYLSAQNLAPARQHYRDSLNIRWSKLGQNHPKVTRLLEKISSIEMMDTPLKLQQQKEDNLNTNNERINDLGEDVRDDLSYVTELSRRLALDMIRDRIIMIRQMRRLEVGEDETPPATNINDDNNDCCSTTSSTDNQSESSMILHGSKDALSIITESVTKLEEQRSQTITLEMGAHIVPISPPDLVRTVSNDFGE